MLMSGGAYASGVADLPLSDAESVVPNSPADIVALPHP
jgi:hypothetical protein